MHLANAEALEAERQSDDDGNSLQYSIVRSVRLSDDDTF
jgi:hypothetical protein